MTTLILGVGVGLFVILSLWVLAALIFVVSLRVERKVGAIAILLVSALTIVLLSVPRASEKPAPADGKVYDRLFVWRVVLLILLLVSSVISLVGYIKYGLVEAVRPVRISSWVL
ncbi:PREDICTED: transmembrane protein 218-like [Wasmannia auropunctata]|uniref:transmembrane protein 218-like n=1 Tax=Wasmannia auropunctata TaxID=64793 RepID=UPI0005EFC360|nr:PREDICTED: transmembrane protein 218-like [Wasmannia auropunctata]